MKLSIIIVSHKTKDLLFDCLSSIFKNLKNEFPFEVIVVDNASNDGTVEVLGKDFPAVRLIQNSSNVGFAAANNQGIKTSNGEYILLLNPDTIMLNGAIQETLKFMEEHPEAHIVGCKLLNQDGSLQHSCRSFPSVVNSFFVASFLYKLFPRSKTISGFHMTWFDHHEVRQVDLVTGAFLMTTKKVFQDVGLLDESFFLYSEETDFCLRARKMGYRVFFFPGAAVIHLIGRSSAEDQATMFSQIHRGKMQFYKKYFSGGRLVGMVIIEYLGIIARVIVYFIGGIILFRPALIKKSRYYFLSVWQLSAIL